MLDDDYPALLQVCGYNMSNASYNSTHAKPGAGLAWLGLGVFTTGLQAIGPAALGLDGLDGLSGPENLIIAHIPPKF